MTWVRWNHCILCRVILWILTTFNFRLVRMVMMPCISNLVNKRLERKSNFFTFNSDFYLVPDSLVLSKGIFCIFNATLWIWVPGLIQARFVPGWEGLTSLQNSGSVIDQRVQSYWFWLSFMTFSIHIPNPWPYFFLVVQHKEVIALAICTWVSTTSLVAWYNGLIQPALVPFGALCSTSHLSTLGYLYSKAGFSAPPQSS